MSEAHFDLPPHMRERYHYLVFPVGEIVPMLTPADPAHPDAYLAADATSTALRACLADGFRWVRTDGEWAVFEKVTLWTPRPK